MFYVGLKKFCDLQWWIQYPIQDTLWAPKVWLAILHITWGEWYFWSEMKRFLWQYDLNLWIEIFSLVEVVVQQQKQGKPFTEILLGTFISAMVRKQKYVEFVYRMSRLSFDDSVWGVDDCAKDMLEVEVGMVTVKHRRRCQVKSLRSEFAEVCTAFLSANHSSIKLNVRVWACSCCNHQVRLSLAKFITIRLDTECCSPPCIRIAMVV